MTDQEIDLLSTAIATKIAAVLDARLGTPLPALLRAPSIYEPVIVPQNLHKKRGWPKGKKRKP